MTVNLEIVASAVASLTAIGVPIGYIAKKVLFVANKLTEHSEDLTARKEENTVILKGTLACLKGLQEMGCNGPVTQAISDIETHLIGNR